MGWIPKRLAPAGPAAPALATGDEAVAILSRLARGALCRAHVFLIDKSFDRRFGVGSL